jgi:hypothetical protein
MGFKISPRVIGFSAGLQLLFSIVLALRSRAESGTIRARRNNPGGLFRLLRSVRSIQHVTAAATGPGWRSTVEIPPDLCTFDAKVLR